MPGPRLSERKPDLLSSTGCLVLFRQQTSTAHLLCEKDCTDPQKAGTVASSKMLQIQRTEKA